jgi:hypothetical protein
LFPKSITASDRQRKAKQGVFGGIRGIRPARLVRLGPLADKAPEPVLVFAIHPDNVIPNGNAETMVDERRQFAADFLQLSFLSLRL